MDDDEYEEYRKTIECPHLPEHRRYGIRQVVGHDVRVEECVACGRVLVHPEDAQRVLSENKLRNAPSRDED